VFRSEGRRVCKLVRLFALRHLARFSSLAV
jgi:hypothetical protein